MNLKIPDYVASLPLTVLNTVVIYIFLIVAFRLLGRRQLGQLNVIDLVVILIMGSAVETAMIDGNISLPAGLVSAVSLLFVNRILAALAAKFKRFRRLVGGSPVVLVSHGHVIEESLRRTGLTKADLDEALRGRGCEDCSCVAYAVMEEDGQISVVENDGKIIRTDKPIAAPPGQAGAKPAV